MSIISFALVQKLQLIIHFKSCNVSCLMLSNVYSIIN